MILTIADLTPDANSLQHKILCEHIPDIGIDLCHCVCVLHALLPISTIAAALCKFSQHPVYETKGSVLPEFFGKLHRLIDRHAGGHIIIITDLIDSQTQDR